MTGAGPKPDWAPASLFPCQPRFLEVGGARVHYVDEGSGPVILMLHGNPTWSFLYRKVIAGLEGQFRCVALDYPGFGLSSAPPDYGFRSEEHALVVEISAWSLAPRSEPWTTWCLACPRSWSCCRSWHA